VTLVAVPAHVIPAGPLAVRWLAYELPRFRAGAEHHVRVQLENAGSATWHQSPASLVCAAYHWLDPLGNAIVWDGTRTPLPALVPGERLELSYPVRAPIPPGRYLLALDLIDEGRFWFEEVGSPRIEREVVVEPRLDDGAIAVHAYPVGGPGIDRTVEAIAAQAELADDGEILAFVAPGCVPGEGWAERTREAHADGYAYVAGSLELPGRPGRRRRPSGPLEPWLGSFGRMPGWQHGLLCPTVLREALDTFPGVTLELGLPLLATDGLTEPWCCDGRIRMLAPADLRPAG
jgi:hypothetical protein